MAGQHTKKTVAFQEMPGQKPVIWCLEAITLANRKHGTLPLTETVSTDIPTKCTQLA